MGSTFSALGCNASSNIKDLMSSDNAEQCRSITATEGARSVQLSGISGTIARAGVPVRRSTCSLVRTRLSTDSAAKARMAAIITDASSATARIRLVRSEEHTSELQSLMRISYAVFCLKTKNHPYNHSHNTPPPTHL